MTNHRIVLIILLAADVYKQQYFILHHSGCIVPPFLNTQVLSKINTYRWLSAIRATCTTTSFSKGPWKIMTESLLALLTKDFIQYSTTRDTGYLNNPQLWQTALSALLFLVVWANWKIYTSQAHRKPVPPIILCKTHFGELVINRFLVILTLFGLVWGFH